MKAPIYDFLDFHIVGVTVTTSPHRKRDSAEYNRFINAMRCWEERFRAHVDRAWAKAVESGEAESGYAGFWLAKPWFRRTASQKA